MKSCRLGLRTCCSADSDHIALSAVGYFLDTLREVLGEAVVGDSYCLVQKFGEGIVLVVGS